MLELPNSVFHWISHFQHHQNGKTNGGHQESKTGIWPICPGNVVVYTRHTRMVMNGLFSWILLIHGQEWRSESTVQYLVMVILGPWGPQDWGISNID